jgi:hypothetical protein
MQINTQQKNQKKNKTEKLFFLLRSGFFHWAKSMDIKANNDPTYKSNMIKDNSKTKRSQT